MIYVNDIPTSACIDTKATRIFYLDQILISDFSPVTTAFSVLFGNSKVQICS